MGNKQKLLTIIMAYLNEGNEPRMTIESIYSTASSTKFNINAIDDCSDEEGDEFSDLDEVTYIRNEKRIGVQASKQMGVELANTPYVLLIDAHMRFKEDNWCERIIDALKKEPETIFGVTCVALTMEDKDIPLDNKLLKGFGASIEFISSFEELNSAKLEVIYPKWINKYSKYDEYPNDEIPCLLGACYGVSRSFFLKIKGLQGLKLWGSTEAYLSIKAWLAGGKCKLLKEIEVGHKFRKKAPYTTDSLFPYYNQIFLFKTIFPVEFTDKLLELLPSSKTKELAMMVVEYNEKDISNFRDYYQSLFIISIRDYFEYFNVKVPDELGVMC